MYPYLGTAVSCPAPSSSLTSISRPDGEDLQRHIASYLPSQDFEKLHIIDSTLDLLAALKSAISDEDRDPTLDDFHDFQIAETNGWYDDLKSF